VSQKFDAILSRMACLPNIRCGRRPRGVRGGVRSQAGWFHVRGADLLAMSDARLDAWMRRKAALGDGTRAGIPLLPAGALLAAIDERERSGAIPCASGPLGAGRSLATVLRAGVLRDFAGKRVRDAARRLGWSGPTISRLHAAHRRGVLRDEAYRGVVLAVIRRALACADRAEHLEESLQPFLAGEVDRAAPWAPQPRPASEGSLPGVVVAPPWNQLSWLGTLARPRFAWGAPSTRTSKPL
jgi:hypothetical protein